VEGVLPLAGQTLEGLRKDFRKGTKWSLKKGLSGPVRVARLTSDSELRQAYDAWKATAKRKGFLGVRPWPALQPVLRHCVDNSLGSVLGTLLDDRVLAAVFVTFIGKTASWVYGGYVDGSETYQPTHVLQYAAFQESLERGMNAYTFGYLVSEGESQKNGVDDFKLGFGAIPSRNLDTITWECRPLANRCLEWSRRQTLGKRIEKLLKKRLYRRGEG
jgi:lipid II:glycine glycyltransferase (peptidoglycan interpeptide bridge formation enzyme)